jgi:hypothetical protein
MKTNQIRLDPLPKSFCAAAKLLPKNFCTTFKFAPKFLKIHFWSPFYTKFRHSVPQISHSTLGA